MTTALHSLSIDGSTDGNFQAFCTAIDTDITGFGWVNTADTGQITPASVTHPSANSDAGYRIYSTNDGLTTWYLKIIFGNDASSKIRMKISIATGTNGAGTLSGQVSAVVTHDWVVAPSSPTNVALSGANNRLMIFYGTYNGNRSCNGISIHRTVDNTGVVSDDGMEVFAAPSSGVNCQFVPKTGTVPAQITSIWPVIFTNANTGVVGSNTRYGHPMLWGESLVTNPTLAVMVWGKNDFTPTTTTTKTLTVYSASRTYLLENDLHNSVWNSGNTGLGWRYE